MGPLVSGARRWGQFGQKERCGWEFPGGPVVRTRHFHCGARFPSLAGELRSCKLQGAAKKKKERKKTKRKIWIKLEEGGALKAVETRRLKMEAGTR